MPTPSPLVRHCGVGSTCAARVRAPRESSTMCNHLSWPQLGPAPAPAETPKTMWLHSISLQSSTDCLAREDGTRRHCSPRHRRRRRRRAGRGGGRPGRPGAAGCGRGRRGMSGPGARARRAGSRSGRPRSAPTGRACPRTAPPIASRTSCRLVSRSGSTGIPPPARPRRASRRWRGGVWGALPGRGEAAASRGAPAASRRLGGEAQHRSAKVREHRACLGFEAPSTFKLEGCAGGLELRMSRWWLFSIPNCPISLHPLPGWLVTRCNLPYDSYTISVSIYLSYACDCDSGKGSHALPNVTCGWEGCLALSGCALCVSLRIQLNGMQY